MSLGAVDAFEGSRGDAPPVALLSNDAEVAEFQPALVADEHVERRQIAVEHLAAMQLAEHLEDAGDLPAGGSTRASRLAARWRNALKSPCGAYSSARQ